MQHMEQEVFDKSPHPVDPKKCKHGNIVRLYINGAHADYGCLDCGAEYSELKFFEKSVNNLTP